MNGASAMGSCLRLSDIEEISSDVTIQSIRGKLEEASVHGKNNFVATVKVRLQSGGTQKLDLCNENISSYQSLLDSLQELNNGEIAIFYNKADYSQVFRCFPVVLLNDVSKGKVVMTSGAERYFPSGPGALEAAIKAGGELVTLKIDNSLPARTANKLQVDGEEQKLSSDEFNLDSTMGKLEIRRIKTSSGELGYNVASLNGQLLELGSNADISVPFYYPAQKATIIVLQLGTGGNSCSAHYRILDLNGEGPSLSNELDACYGDIPHARFSEGTLLLTLPRADISENETWRYRPATSNSVAIFERIKQ